MDFFPVFIRPILGIHIHLSEKEFTMELPSNIHQSALMKIPPSTDILVIFSLPNLTCITISRYPRSFLFLLDTPKTIIAYTGKAILLGMLTIMKENRQLIFAETRSLCSLLSTGEYAVILECPYAFGVQNRSTLTSHERPTRYGAVLWDVLFFPFISVHAISLLFFPLPFLLRPFPHHQENLPPSPFARPHPDDDSQRPTNNKKNEPRMLIWT